MSVERSLPVQLPPSPFIKKFSSSLPKSESLQILDAGASEGRNGIHLASLGHRVVALSLDRREALSGANISREHLATSTGDCQFVIGDIRALMFPRVFDAVIVNEVLHMMTKYQARAALKGLADITTPGGLHAVSGYVVNPREANVTNKRHMFHPNELLNIYRDAEWQVLEYTEDAFDASEVNGRQVVHSLARIVATR